MQMHNNPPQILWDLECCLWDVVREVESETASSLYAGSAGEKLRKLVGEMEHLIAVEGDCVATIVSEKLGEVARRGVCVGKFGGDKMQETADLIVDLHKRIEELENELQSRR